MASHLFPTTPIKSASPSPNPNPILFAPSSVRASLSTSFISPFVGGSVSGDFSGHKIRPASLNPYSSGTRSKRGVVTMVPEKFLNENCAVHVLYLPSDRRLSISLSPSDCRQIQRSSETAATAAILKASLSKAATAAPDETSSDD
ncbi:ATP-dependent Clp protease proteolytic subunit [Abeliophyllum distichum]|uniref:ATP-dependent Clp protease proteolytic subunit n=1 Tax=Abeliophyllum distichum TaxID=126358 RepID=A0ABD1UMP9_9LAMI